MKPAPFAYVRARSVNEVFDLLEDRGQEARILAGGQSLLATLALRLSEPALLVDIGALRELRFIGERGGSIHIGALTRHCELETNALVSSKLPLVSQAMPNVAHAAIRNRGTIGGSLALADPAAELPACMVALEAALVLASRAGERRVRAADFFKGYYETDLRAGELLVRVEIPVSQSGWRFHFDEFSRRHGDYAIAGLAAVAHGTGGKLDEVRLVFFGCGAKPVRAPAAEAVAAGAPAEPRYAALRAALDHDLDPQTDLHAGPEMRKHLAAVLADRAIGALTR